MQTYRICYEADMFANDAYAGYRRRRIVRHNCVGVNEIERTSSVAQSGSVVDGCSQSEALNCLVSLIYGLNIDLLPSLPLYTLLSYAFHCLATLSLLQPPG